MLGHYSEESLIEMMNSMMIRDCNRYSGTNSGDFKYFCEKFIGHYYEKAYYATYNINTSYILSHGEVSDVIFVIKNCKRYSKRNEKLYKDFSSLYNTYCILARKYKRNDKLFKHPSYYWNNFITGYINKTNKECHKYIVHPYPNSIKVKKIKKPKGFNYKETEYICSVMVLKSLGNIKKDKINIDLQILNELERIAFSEYSPIKLKKRDCCIDDQFDYKFFLFALVFIAFRGGYDEFINHFLYKIWKLNKKFGKVIIPKNI